MNLAIFSSVISSSSSSSSSDSYKDEGGLVSREAGPSKTIAPEVEGPICAGGRTAKGGQLPVAEDGGGGPNNPGMGAPSSLTGGGGTKYWCPLGSNVPWVMISEVPSGSGCGCG